MSVPSRRRDNNLQLSVRKHFKDNFETAYGITVNWSDAEFDETNEDLWAEFNVLSSGAGRMEFMLVQIDVFSRVRGQMPTGDRLGSNLRDAADKVIDAMHVRTIQVYDFSTPASPVLLTAQKLMVQNSNGTFREPEEDRYAGIENGVARRTITFRLRLPDDASGQQSYYD